MAHAILTLTVPVEGRKLTEHELAQLRKRDIKIPGNSLLMRDKNSPNNPNRGWIAGVLVSVVDSAPAYSTKVSHGSTWSV